jgi:hypothetical protein
VTAYVYEHEAGDTKKVGRRERAVKAAAAFFGVDRRTIERKLAKFYEWRAAATQAKTALADIRSHHEFMLNQFPQGEREQLRMGDIDIVFAKRILRDRAELAKLRFENTRLRARTKQLRRRNTGK